MYAAAWRRVVRQAAKLTHTMAPHELAAVANALSHRLKRNYQRRFDLENIELAQALAEQVGSDPRMFMHKVRPSYSLSDTCASCDLALASESSSRH